MKVSDAQLKQLRDSFNKYDKSHDGFISTQEMVKVLVDCHENPQDVEQDAIKVVDMLDANKDGSISFVEVLKALSIIDKVAEVEVDDIILACLQQLRKSNPSDVIKYEASPTVAKLAGIPLEDLKKYEATFKNADKNADGGLDFEEFKQEAGRLKLAFDEGTLQEKFASKDLNKDGKISWEEFVEAMLFYKEKKANKQIDITIILYLSI